MNVIPFEKDHLTKITLRDVEKNILKSPNGFMPKVIAASSFGTSGTFLFNKEILCCAGYISLWSGVADFWILPSTLVAKYPIQFSKAMKAYFDNVANSENLHRAQTVSIDDELHCRWLEWLGFECEGVLKQYSMDKKNYKMWGKIYGI